jgi:hypothetical protein
MNLANRALNMDLTYLKWLLQSNGGGREGGNIILLCNIGIIDAIIGS